MSDSSVSVTIDPRQGEKRLAAMPELLRGRLRSVVVRDGKQLAALVRGNLSGRMLKSRSGDLLKSVKNEMVESATSVYGRVYSDGVPYAGIQERGGRTRAHMIYPVRARALHFMMGGKDVFAAFVHHPGSNIPSRPYMRAALEEMRPRLVADMSAAAKEGWN